MDSPFLPAIIAFTPFFAMLIFLAMRRPKHCPDCGEPLPAFQSPFTKTMRQWIEGGYVCQNCGCEADLAGKRVQLGVTLRASSLVFGSLLVLLAGVPAGVCLFMLLQR